MTGLPPAATRVLTAYGGAETWGTAVAVEASVDVGGPLFRWKRRRRIPRLAVRAELAAPVLRLTPMDAAGSTGILDGADVRLVAPNGLVLARRGDARAGFPYGRRLLAWDTLDLTYFLGYALWNYLALPALLLRSDVTWRESGPGDLTAEFPDHLPTHCRHQRFHFDEETGLLRRLDYTAEAFGGWAHAAHLVTEHTERDGVVHATARRVVPRVGGRALPGPTLIWAQVLAPRLVTSAGDPVPLGAPA